MSRSYAPQINQSESSYHELLALVSDTIDALMLLIDECKTFHYEVVNDGDVWWDFVIGYNAYEWLYLSSSYPQVVGMWNGDVFTRDLPPKQIEFIKQFIEMGSLV